jgi:SAM-dependent methyltransferase
MVTGMTTLDVGCGCKCLGDVNVDRDASFPADIHHDLNILPLPFHDKQFQKVYCYHALEHLEDPVKVLDELRRIGRVVEIRVPHRAGTTAKKDPTHKHFLNLKWFIAYAKSRGCHVQGHTLMDWERFTIRNIIPLEIRVWLW